MGVRGEAGSGRERDCREFAMRTKVNLDERGGERSWVRMAFPTPPRPIKATGMGRVVGIVVDIYIKVGKCIEWSEWESSEFWIF